MTSGTAPETTLNDLLAAKFIAQVRQIDGQLADICQHHLDQGYSLNTVMNMLNDAQRIAGALRAKATGAA